MADPMTRDAMIAAVEAVERFCTHQINAAAARLDRQANAEAVQACVRVHAVLAALRAAPPADGSVMVRVDPVYVEQMRGEGLAGPFSRVQLDERDGVPTLLLTVAPTPTPDTVEYWREVAQELATEIHKLRGLAAPKEPQ